MGDYKKAFSLSKFHTARQSEMKSTMTAKIVVVFVCFMAATAANAAALAQNEEQIPKVSEQ